MIQTADLIALLADVGVVDVRVGDAVVDEHVRSAAYQRIVSVAVAGQDRDGDRGIVAAILGEPQEVTSKSAVVAFVDKIAMTATDPAAFEQWAARILPETDRFTTEAYREFVRQRVRDWLFYLSVRDGHTPAPAEVAGVTHWMQRRLADDSTPLPVLMLLAEYGVTKKIRNVAKNRAASRELRTRPVPGAAIP